MSHFINAWAATLDFFSEQVRITGTPLNQFAHSTVGSEHRWVCTAERSSTGSPSADLPREVGDSVDYMREQERMGQSLPDRQRAVVKGGGKDNWQSNSKGKGVGKDKGKGKYKSKKGDNDATRGYEERRRRDRSRGRSQHR